MSCLVDLMGNVYEDEDTDFEDLLSADELKKLKSSRTSASGTSRRTSYAPVFALRPSAAQVHLRGYARNGRFGRN
jgi:hypothetical protein